MILSNDQLLFLGWLCGSIPSSSVYRSLPSNPKFIWMKHIISIVWCFVMYLTVFGSIQFFIGIVPVMLTWIIGLLMNNLRKQRKIYAVLAVWIGSIGYLSAYHINRIMKYGLFPLIDSTTMQMMITIKLTQFITENYYSRYSDGRYPTFLEWLGFIYFIPSFLAGPVLSLEEYQNFIKYHSSTTNEYTHSTTSQISILIYKGSLLMVMALLGLTVYNPKMFLSEQFSAMSFTEKLAYSYVIMLLFRCRYYFIWTMTEISYIVSGASTFVQFKGRNTDILDTEFASNVYGITNAWNKKTNAWLKECVYKPLSNAKYKQWQCILTTNMVSAIWHGFYPGYYITFVLGGTSTFLGRMWRKQISSRIDKLEIPIITQVYNLCKIPVTMTLATFVSIPFGLFSLTSTISVYNSLRWYGLIMIIMGWGIVIGIPRISRFTSNHQMLQNSKDD